MPTEPLVKEIERAFPERPFTIELWDGSRIPSTNGGGPTFTARSRDALAYAVSAPGQLGLGRAYVAGEIEVDDMDAVIALLNDWQPPSVGAAAKARLITAALRAAGARRPPPAPRAEMHLRGRKHTSERDREAVRHHYDVGNEFFSLFLDSSMTYSCAFFSRVPQRRGLLSGDRAPTLEEAQEAKLDLVCTKLGLREGERVLDVGCGWGSFVMHAASRYGTKAVGITLSEPQAELARRRVEEAGLSDRIEIRVQDYRELAGEQFDAVASIGMVEHVGEAQIDTYAEQLASMLRSGGRLLNHGISRLKHGNVEGGPFSERYVFPDGETLHVSRVILALERAGFIARHVEEFGADYAETLRHWIRRLDENGERAEELAGPERMRVWRLYLRAARNGFEIDFTSVYQVLCRLGSS
ncbi:MAG TPA: cyclopropane-fatty-acyl-phospholipid synthase family protein [Solirubrobacterales bacterium]|jgi:cyclopropane-fatty-acyl-phospholipid synthase|nr:cyclopropane-fatty-acyl-phospholipid synthase family protein [Solirubrobacterales bacterium]